MNDHSPGMLRPALIAGAAFGFLGGLPFFDLLNICTCCSFVIGSGVLAAYLQSRECSRAGASFSAGNGALVGLLAGVFYAVAETIVGSLMHLLFGGLAYAVLERVADKQPEIEDWLDLVVLGEVTAFGILLGFFLTLLTGVIFATVGGLIGGALFEVTPAPPPSAPAADSDRAPWAEPSGETGGGRAPGEPPAGSG